MIGDITLSCTDCKCGFIWTAGEQQWYAEKGFKEPKRCEICRQVRKEWKNKLKGGKVNG
jgi:N-acetylglutamate synthase-like GNAT family acetyltransferase